MLLSSLRPPPSSNSSDNPKDPLGAASFRSGASGSTVDHDEADDDRPIRFGDTITLSDLESRGLVIGDVGVSSGVWLDQRHESEGAVRDFPDVQNSAFTVCHKFQYAATKDFEKRLRQRHGLDKGTWQDKVDPSSSTYSELEASHLLVQDEVETNSAELLRKAGDVVTYGTVVQLLHRGSDKFLTQLKNRAAKNKLAMEVALVTNGVEGSWWQLLPGERIRAMGDEVRSGDRVSLENFKLTKSYLCFGEGDGTEGLCKSLGQSMGQSGLPPHPSIAWRHEVHAYAYPALFRLRIFTPLENCRHVSSVLKGRLAADDKERRDSAMLGTDCVTLTHKHHDSVLVGDTEAGTVAWRPRAVLEAEARAHGASHTEPCALWRVCLRELAMGGSAVSARSPQLVLEHVASGLYLACNHAGVGLQPYPSDADCHWQLMAKPCSGQEKGTPGAGYLHDGDIAWVRSVGGWWLSHETRLESGGLQICSQCRRSELVPARARAGRRENQDMVQLRLVRGGLAGQVDFMRRCRGFLSGLQAELLNEGAFESAVGADDSQVVAAVKAHPLHRVLGCFLPAYDELMCTLIRGCTISDEPEVLSRAGSAVPSHQALLRKCGLIESCMRLIICLFTELRLPVLLVKDHLPKVFRTARLAYLLVERACLDCQESKLSMLPYYSVFQEHVRGMVGAYFAMLAVFSGTRQLIETVDMTRLLAWRGMLKKMRSCKLLAFFQETCTVKGEPVRRNQDRMCEVLVEDRDTLYVYASIVGGDLILRDPLKPDQRPTSVKSVRQMFGDDVMHPNNLDHADHDLQLYQVFMQILKLFADTVHGRNTAAIEKLVEVAPRYCISFGLLQGIIALEGLPCELRSRCVVLLTKLYVDVDPHQPVETLVTNRVWSRLLSDAVTERFGNVARQKSSQQELVRPQALLDYKAILLGHVRGSSTVDAEEIAKNKLTNCVLDAISDLMRFGFFHKFDPRHRSPVLDFDQAGPLSEALVALIDGRTDLASKRGRDFKMASSKSSSVMGSSTHRPEEEGMRPPVESLREVEGRHISTEKTIQVMIAKVRALKLIRTLFAACTDIRISRFVEFWEALLEKRFGESACFPQQQGRRASYGNGKHADSGVVAVNVRAKGGRNGFSAAPGSKESAEVVAMGMLAGEVRDGASLHGESNGDSNGDSCGDSCGGKYKGDAAGWFPSGLLPYVSDHDKWRTEPPWNEEDLKELSEACFGSEVAMLAEGFSLSGIKSMFERGNGWLIPEWIKIVLDLVRYECPFLKEEGIGMLISSFNQQASFVSTLKRVHFIYCPRIAKRFFDMRSDVLQLRGFYNALQSNCCEEKARACERARDIIKSWTQVMTRTEKWSAFDVKEMQKCASSLGCVEACLFILGTPLARTPPTVPGKMDAADDAEVASVLEQVVQFLARLCRMNGDMQLKLLEHEELITSLLGVEGIDAEGLFGEIARDNPRVVERVGVKWICLLFNAVIGKYGRRRERVFEAAGCMMKCNGQGLKDNQTIVMSMFKKHDSIVGHFFQADEEWDTRIRLMEMREHITGGASSELAFHLSAVKLLYTASEGKNPAAEVYAANYLSLFQVLDTILNLDVSRTTRERSRLVTHDTLCTVRAAFMRLLLHVYVDTRVERLLQEQRSSGSGMWAWDLEVDEGAGRDSLPLMHFVSRELKMFCARCSDAKWEDVSFPDKDFFFGAVVQLLTFYYKDSYPAVRGSSDSDVQVSEDIFDSCALLYNCTFGGGKQCLTFESPDEGTIDCRERLFNILRVMSSEGGIREEWARSNHAHAVVCTRPMDSNAIRISLGEGTHRMIHDLANSWGILEHQGLVGLGHRQLACLLSRKGDVNLYDSPHLLLSPHQFKQAHSKPSYDDFVQAILHVSGGGRTSAPILRDILVIMRLILYVKEPSDPERPPEEAITQWDAFLEHAPIEKHDDQDGTILRWLQAKYSKLGCTEAALRLMSHSDESVKTAALSLLCALLQGGNAEVQKDVVDYFARSQDVRPFDVMVSVVGGAMDRLKEYKKILKRLKLGAGVVGRRSSESYGEASSGGAGGMWGFGKKSSVMLMLRLVQLLCEGQFTRMQDLCRHQPFAADSQNIISKLSDLFEAIQPLILDAMRFNDGSLVVLAMQVCDTLQELVQGPNVRNQSELVSATSFFASVNRMLSSVAYTDLAADQTRVDGLNVSTNDLKCWLKSSLLSCCLSVMEGATDPSIPRRTLGFFELRNIEAQILQCGELLRLQHGKGKLAAANDSKSKEMQLNPCQYRTCKSAKKSLSDRAAKKRFAAGWEDAILSELLNYYILLLNFREWDESGAVKASIAKMSREHPLLHRFLSRHVCDVEIVRNGSGTDSSLGRMFVERVFFPVDPTVMKLTLTRDFRKKTSDLMFDVPRSNPQEKAKAFLRKMVYIAHSVRWMTVNLANPARAVVIRKRDVLEVVPLSISIVITVCLLVFYGIPMDPNTNSMLGGGKFWSEESPAGYMDEPYPYANLTSDPYGNGAMYSGIFGESDLSLKFRLRMVSRWDSMDEWKMWPAGRTLLSALAILHMIMTLNNSIIYLTQDLPLTLLETIDRQRKRQDPNLPLLDDDEAGGLPFELGASLTMEESEAPKRMHTACSLQFVKELCWDARYACYLAFMSIISILGVLRSPFFFVCFLFDYFRLPDGVLVLQAVILGGPNLARSFVLGMIVIVCFGFYSYAYFSRIVNVENELCHSPMQCVAKHILDSVTGDLSTVLGNDFGNFAFPALLFWEDAWHGWRTLFVFVSLIFWVFLLQSIIQGQIIDAFAEMRSRRTFALQDLEEKCFVSSIDRFEFNNYPGEWDKRRGGKYAWHYVYYASHLLNKNREEYTGLENDVAIAFAQERTSFLPVEQFVSRQRQESTGTRHSGDDGLTSDPAGALREEINRLKSEVSVLSRVSY